MHRIVEIQQFLAMALECSVYSAPTDPGLTQAELLEAARRAGYGPGETADAIRHQQASYTQGDRGRMLPDTHRASSLVFFHHAQEPDYRDAAAFDFVFRALRHETQERGEGKGRMEREVVVQRGVDQGMKRHDLEVAVTTYLLGGAVVEQDGLIGFQRGTSGWALPGDQVGQRRGGPLPMPLRAKAHPLVQDIVQRRSDGRAASPEPLSAFAEQLDRLGHGPFRMWWVQMVGEFRRSSAEASPVTTCVLAAALVEGALTFVVKHARAENLGPMGSTDFSRPPRTWKIDDLIDSAARGGQDTILDANAKHRADTLVRTRQRIHAGRMLEEFSGGPPDLRPEEARDARATAELVVRRILEWLDRHPPT